MAVLKVFADRLERRALLDETRLVEAYDAFVVVEADEATAAALATRYPVEDITPQYRLSLGGVLQDPLGRPEGPAAQRALRQAARAPADGAPHHYIV